MDIHNFGLFYLEETDIIFMKPAIIWPYLVV